MTSTVKKLLQERANSLKEVRSELAEGTDLFDLLSEVQDKFDSSAGHTHAGTSEDAPQLDWDTCWSDAEHSHESSAEGALLTPGKFLNTASYVYFFDDFLGYDLNVTDGFWQETDTSAAGSPTLGIATDAHAGEYQLKCDNTDEAQYLTLSFGDQLQFDIDKDIVFEARFKVCATDITTNERVVIGMAGNRNDTLDSVAQHAWFRLEANMNILLESDDGTNDNNDKDSGVDATADSYNTLKIDFSDTSNVLFYIDGTNYTASTTFDMSNYNGALQPIVELQKDSGTTTPEVRIDYIKITCAR